MKDGEVVGMLTERDLREHAGVSRIQHSERGHEHTGGNMASLKATEGRSRGLMAEIHPPRLNGLMRKENVQNGRE